MPPPYCYDYPRPAVTVDLVAFAFDGEHVRVLLIRRKNNPFAGKLALPGGFLDIDEPVETAARRELKEETGLEVGPVELLNVYGDPDRDPRGRTISLAHVAPVPWPPPATAGGDDAEDATWLDPADAHDLAFDHARILADARERLLSWTVVPRPATLILLPETFGRDEYGKLLHATGAQKSTPYPDPYLDRLEELGLIARVPEQEGRYRVASPTGTG